MMLEPKRFIVLDLELEQSNANNQVNDSLLPNNTEKIIQLGFVVIELGRIPKILHEEIVHLYYDKQLSTFIRTLTTIEGDDLLNSKEDAASCLKRLQEVRELFNASRQLVQWGGGDDRMLAKESGLELNRDFGFANSSINVKHLFQMYALANDINGKGGLSKSMNKLHIPFVNTRYKGKNKGAHWALTDAKNTAIIFNELINLF